MSEEDKRKLGRFSAFSDPKGTIDSYNGATIDVRIGEDSKQKIKLTDGELLSLYLTLKQTGDPSIFPEADSPAVTLIKQGFHLDKIESYPFIMWTPNTSQEYIIFNGKVGLFLFPSSFDLPVTYYFNYLFNDMFFT